MAASLSANVKENHAAAQQQQQNDKNCGCPGPEGPQILFSCKIFVCIENESARFPAGPAEKIVISRPTKDCPPAISATVKYR